MRIGGDAGSGLFSSLLARAKSVRLWGPHALIALAATAVYGALLALDGPAALRALREAQDGVALEMLLLFGQILAIALAVTLIFESRRLKAEAMRRRAAESEAERLAQRDHLTGLANRRHLSAVAPQLIAEAEAGGRHLAALLVDLDRLKPVNDTLGHAVGDHMITTVAARIERSAPQGAVVARIGGDEFVVVYPLDAADAQAAATGAARRMLAQVAKPIGSTGAAVGAGVGAGIGLGAGLSAAQQLDVSASIGVATAEPAEGLEQLLRRADQAMYCAKGNGRNQVAHFDEAMGELLRKRAALETDMLRALKADEFEPYFQPLVDLGTDDICGVEVLARWRHPTRGVVLPVEFVPIAEEAGVIGELSEAVLRKACRAAARWPNALTLAFNVSPLQFRDPNLASAIHRVLAETGFPPERLEIELTENAVILDLDAARATLAELKETGVRVALDDFGTGYSSLSSLRQLQFDKVKIDRSFVTDAQDDTENRKIVEGILGLTQSLGLTTTAEGIESAEEEAWLKRLGCDQGQGYLFSRPVNADELSFLLDARDEQAEPHDGTLQKRSAP